MINFRYHRGGFEESMATLRQFESFEAMCSALTAEHKGEVLIRDYGYDERVKADTRLVTHDGFPLGFAWESPS